MATALSLSRRTLGGFVTIGLCWGAFAATVPALKAGLGVSDGAFGALLLVSSAGLVTAMWAAPWADRRLGRWSLPAGAGTMAAVFPLLGAAPDPLAFALAMVALGGLSGLTDVVTNARVADLEAAHGRALMNANHAVFSFAYAGAAVLAGLGREAGLPPWAILGAPALVVLPFLAAMAVAPAATASPAPGRPPAVLPGWLVALCGGVVLIGFSAEAAVESWSALHVERTLGGRAAEGALGPAILGLTMGTGRLAGQALAERLADRVMLRGATVLSAAGAALAAAAPSPAVAYLGFAVLGLGISVIGPLGLALAGRLVPADVRTRAISRVAVIGFAAFFLAPIGMGLLAEIGGLRLSFFGLALLLILTWPLVAALERRRPALA